MSKRILSLLLAVCMVLSLSINVFASNVATYMLYSPSRIKAGEQITVSVDLDYTLGMLETNGLGFILPFDPEQIAYLGHNVDSNIEDGAVVEVGDDYVKLTYEIDGVNSVYSLMEVYFQVLEGVNPNNNVWFTLEEYWANEAVLHEGEVLSAPIWPELKDSCSVVIVPCDVHDWVLKEGTPTCTKASEQYEKCRVCDAVQNAVIIEPLGHNMVNGTCSRCGYREGVLISGDCGSNAKWEICEDGTLFISGTGATYDYVDNGMMPVWLEAESRALIDKIVIDEGITRIGTWTFVELGEVHSVNLPSTLETIGFNAFQTTYSLNSVTFAGTKEQWSQVELTEGNEILLEIGVNCKDGWGGTPDSPTEPDVSDKYTNTWITSACEGDQLSIDGFDGILEGVVTIPAYIDGKKVEHIGSNALENQTLVTEVIIEEGIGWTMQGIFRGCTALKKVTIPKSIKTLRNIFINCDNLEVVNYEGSEARWKTVYKPENMIPEGVTLNFMSESSNEWIYVDSGYGEVYISGFDGELVGEVTIPAEINGEQVAVINSRAFVDQTKMTKVIVEDGIYVLHNDLFIGCTSLKEVYLPESIIYMENTFDGCDSLETITFAGNEIQWNKIGVSETLIPEGVTLKFEKELTNQWVYTESNSGKVTINSFNGYLSGVVTIPAYINGKPVRSIAYQALSHQTNITKVIVEEGVQVMSSSVFDGCTSLTEIDIPESVVSLWYCFDGCNNLEVVNYAGSAAKWNGIDKNDDLIPEGVVVNFGKEMSNQWIGVEDGDCVDICSYDGILSGEVVIPAQLNGKRVQMVTRNALANQTGVTKVTVSEGIEDLDGKVFAGCSSLSEINLPESILSLWNCFSDCDNLEVINYAGSEIQWSCIEKSDDLIPEGVIVNFLRQPSNQWLYVESEEMEGVIAIVGFDGILEGEVVIPSEIDGKTVVEINNNEDANGNIHRPFENQSRITSIIVPDSVEYIGGRAFLNCTALTSISLPANLYGMGSNPFYGCTALENIILDNDNQNLVFEDSLLYTRGNDLIVCLSNKEGTCTIPDGISGIGSNAFRDCSNLTTIVIPDSVTSIPENAFSRCTSLEKITHKGTETQWNRMDISYADYLQDVVIEHTGSERWLIKEDGVVYLAGYTGELKGEVTLPTEVDGKKIEGVYYESFMYCDEITKLIVPEGIRYLERDLFEGCTSLTEVTLPESIESLWYCFRYCDSLEVINYAGTEVQWNALDLERTGIQEGVVVNFLKQPSNEWLYEENGDGTIAIVGFDGILEGEVVIPSEVDGKTVTRIDGRFDKNERYRYTFEGQSNITSIVIPDTVATINSIASGNTALQSVTIPSSVQYVWSGDNPFRNCTALEEFNLIGEKHVFAFENGMLFYRKQLVHCVNSISGVCEIPEGITFIHHNAFSSCDKITEIVIPEGVTSITYLDVTNCIYLKTITIPSTVTEISRYVFDLNAYPPVELIDVYYNGTEEQWNAIDIEKGNGGLLNATIHFSEAPVYTTGDPNGDNFINSADVNLLFRAIMDYAELSDAQASAADVNGDGDVNSADVNLLYRFVMGYVDNI